MNERPDEDGAAGPLDPSTLAPVLPADDLARAVAHWSSVLGAAPTFVDGERWAQFDVDGRRLALAGSDAVTDRPAVMVKARDLDAARELLLELGAEAGPIETGPHERRFSASGPGPWDLIVYAAA